MSRFFAQLNDGATMDTPADRMEIVNDSIRVFLGDQMVAFIDVSAVLYALIW